MTAAWEVRDLRHRFPGTGDQAPVQVLDGLSLTAEAGDFVALLGPSGCGKSTVLRILAGLLSPESGTATVAGQPVDDTATTRNRCAYQPQRDTLLPWKRCLDNAVLGAVVAGVPADQARQSALAEWDRFGLTGYEDAWPGALSGGMRQRLALLRAFLSPHEVLLLDEPLGALDAITRRSLQIWLEGVWEEDRRTVLLVTHDIDEALLLADRVVVMSNRPGRLRADIPIPLSRPRDPRHLLSAQATALRGDVLDALEHL